MESVIQLQQQQQQQQQQQALFANNVAKAFVN